MLKDDKFIPGTNFDEITQVHYYDKEIKSKSISAYRFSEKFENEKYAYLIASNYNSDDIVQVANTISSLAGIINKYRKIKNNSISHYINNHGNAPFWILTNYMNFGQLLFFTNIWMTHLKTKLHGTSVIF